MRPIPPPYLRHTLPSIDNHPLEPDRVTLAKMTTYIALRPNLLQASRAKCVDEAAIATGTGTDFYPTRCSDLDAIRFHDTLRSKQYYTRESRDELIHAADLSYEEPETSLRFAVRSVDLVAHPRASDFGAREKITTEYMPLRLNHRFQMNGLCA
ncbi:hypothetical protein FMUND_13725 [Fusarium mundagurra]|uniref:Uncharacterized protein n=1 Tax=Fusarium mundagurra TaxID=1567541 RepID=A0A8H6D3Y9_9HYPO|nr:hypothetical protein FMUND_13725 [Fusarium mundagurra]